MTKPNFKHRFARMLWATSRLAGFFVIVCSARAETTTFTFAQVGSSFSAFLPADDPRVGKEITSARIYLDVESFPGSDAANFFTDLSFPVEPFPGNENAIVLLGSDLGWSGSGTFHYFEETTRFNGTFVSARYGGETPGENFDGIVLDTSRIEFDYIATSEELTLESAAARKSHGHGDFDVDLPLSGETGIESRAGKRKGKVVFSFNHNVVSVNGVTSTCGQVGFITIDPADSHNVIVRLNELICDQTNVTVTLSGVTDDQGNALDSASVAFGILFGDVNEDGVVDNADITTTKGFQGEKTNSENFRADINTDGMIDSNDIRKVKSYRGDRLP